MQPYSVGIISKKQKEKGKRQGGKRTVWLLGTVQFSISAIRCQYTIPFCCVYEDKRKK